MPLDPCETRVQADEVTESRILQRSPGRSHIYADLFRQVRSSSNCWLPWHTGYKVMMLGNWLKLWTLGREVPGVPFLLLSLGAFGWDRCGAHSAMFSPAHCPGLLDQLCFSRLRNVPLLIQWLFWGELWRTMVR